MANQPTQYVPAANACIAEKSASSPSASPSAARRTSTTITSSIIHLIRSALDYTKNQMKLKMESKQNFLVSAKMRGQAARAPTAYSVLSLRQRENEPRALLSEKLFLRGLSRLTLTQPLSSSSSTALSGSPSNGWRPIVEVWASAAA